MRLVLAAVIALAAGCDRDLGPQCRAGVMHYYAAGCTLHGDDETLAGDECTSSGNAVPDGCLSSFDDLFACLNNTPVPVSSSAQCKCDQDWEAAVELCD